MKFIKSLLVGIFISFIVASCAIGLEILVSGASIQLIIAIISPIYLFLCWIAGEIILNDVRKK